MKFPPGSDGTDIVCKVFPFENAWAYSYRRGYYALPMDKDEAVACALTAARALAAEVQVFDHEGHIEQVLKAG